MSRIERLGLRNKSGIKNALGGRHSLPREYCGNNGQVVLIFVEIIRSCRGGLVKRIEERWVMWAKRELVDVMGEIEF